MSDAFVSEKNPLLKEVRRAAHHGSLTADGFALAEGPHLLDEALRSGRGSGGKSGTNHKGKRGVEVGTVIIAESARAQSPVGEARILRVSDATFAGLATTEHPQGVLALVRPPSWTLADLSDPDATPALIVILDGIQDPGNAGAILRAAEAFGATGAVFLKGTVNPYNPKCMRGSAGSVFRLPLVAGITSDDLPPWALYAADPRAATLVSDADLAAPCALVIGSEGRGVSRALATRATGLRIPTTHVESLNAAVAAGILLYEARRQRGAMKPDPQRGAP